MITCNNKELRALLEEVVGYTLLRRNELGKAFILTGHGSNGKSTFLNVLRALIGEENISSLSLQELGQRFKTAELFGKLVNIGDDIPNNYIKDNSVFKKLTTGETMNVEKKGADPFDFRNYSKLFFSANELPQINDTSYGLMRRLVIIPFNANLKKSENYDPYIIDKLTKPEALEYLLLLAIEGLKRVLNNHAFTEVVEVNRAIDEYNLINNPVLQFIQEGKIENELVSDVYRAYGVWCLDNGYESVTKNTLNKEIKKAGYETKKGWVPGLGKVATIYKLKK